MQVVVKAMAMVMQSVMGVSGAESLNVAASIFMGQTEAPLTIRPFLAGLTESELFTIMTSGMAHVSGAVMAAYVKIAGVDITHLLTAVIMTAPATIMLAKIFVPETGKPGDRRHAWKSKWRRPASTSSMPRRSGAGDGLHLALNIAGMLIAFLALIAMCNGILGWVHTAAAAGLAPAIAGTDLRHRLRARGLAAGRAAGKTPPAIGNLLGTRLVLNEFVAFLKLGPMKAHARSALLHHRHLRAVRVREFQLHRHSDRRHRRAGAQPQVAIWRGSACAPWPPEPWPISCRPASRECCCDGRSQNDTSKAARRCGPPSAWCWAAAWARSPTSWPSASRSPTPRFPAGPHPPPWGTPASWSSGKLGALDVAVMAGRAHLYEGYSPAQVTFGVRVLRRLGVRSMVFTNAAGGINLALERGGLVLISDHINLQGSNPLVGPNDDALGPRFPDMSEAYSPAVSARSPGSVAAELCIPMPEGVYAAMLGPSYETPAEIRFLRAIGADVVGMSTVPEVIVANHMGMKVLGISCVTNMAAGMLPQKINHEEVLETGAMVRDTLVRFLKALLPQAGGWPRTE